MRVKYGIAPSCQSQINGNIDELIQSLFVDLQVQNLLSDTTIETQIEVNAIKYGVVFNCIKRHQRYTCFIGTPSEIKSFRTGGNDFLALIETVKSGITWINKHESN